MCAGKCRGSGAYLFYILLVMRRIRIKDKQALGQKLNQQLAQKENEVMAPIQAKFRAAVEKAAKDKGVDLVINARDVIYGGIDLTDAVKANMK